jgi:hypothetical protein
MARMDLSIEHGRTPESAQAAFETGIEETVRRFQSWISQADWADDRRAVRLTGSGFDVNLWYDETALHAQGKVPIAWKLFEPAIRRHIQEAIERAGDGDGKKEPTKTHGRKSAGK